MKGTKKIGSTSFQWFLSLPKVSKEFSLEHKVDMQWICITSVPKLKKNNNKKNLSQ